MSLVTAALLGLGLGFKHAVEADHLAAVCTLVAENGSVMRAVKVGALWGTGHSAVIVLAGGALVAAGVSVPTSIALVLDAAVAVMLIVLGAASLRSARVHKHERHAHVEKRPFRKPLAVGLVHGASGTAALTLLVASTINVRLHALAFVALFGLASIAGMALAAAMLAWPLRSIKDRAPSAMRLLRGFAGAASIAAGIAVAWTVLGSSGQG